MIFETLHDSAQRGELMLVDGGMCHWHLRQDGQLTIREIIATRKGAGSLMLRRLEYTPGASSLFAKCPVSFDANLWYMRKGFYVERMETTRTGRKLLCWRKPLAWARRPNVGGLEVIYCADGNPRMAQLAIDAGWLYGARMPGSVAFRPYFVDQDWKAPDRAVYMARLAQYHPHMATVLDLERPDQLPEVLAWAEDAAQHVNVVVIIPKVRGIIARLPERIAGIPVRLGYSVPTRYGGTTVHISEFARWPHGVHLLGGDPTRQMELYRELPNVRSIDTNYHLKMSGGGMYWAQRPMPPSVASNPHWPTLREAGESPSDDGNYAAFSRSCANIMQAWRGAEREPYSRAVMPVQCAMFASAGT